MKPVRTVTGDEIALGILSKREGDERLIGRELICESDLFPARDETFLRGLRAGVLPPDLGSLALHVIPGESRAPDRVAGYTIELRDGSRSFRRQFGLTSLSSVARRGALRLLGQGAIENGDNYSFFLTTLRADGEALPEETDPVSNGQDHAKVTRRHEPLVFEQARLNDYLDNSELLTGCSAPEEPEAEPPMPVFVSPDVWEEGHSLVRRDSGENERAAVWTGTLLVDTDSPEVFLRLDACLEAEHAQEEKLAVTFSGETWARIRELLERRRRRLNRPNERIVGSLHSHPFFPEADEQGNRRCSACAVAKICSRTTAVASLADLEWHQSVFTGQPWAVLTIWGFNAREEEDWRVYGLSDATLQPRTIRRLK